MQTGDGRNPPPARSPSTPSRWCNAIPHRAATRMAPTSTWRSMHSRWPLPTPTSTPSPSSAATVTSLRWSTNSSSTTSGFSLSGPRLGDCNLTSAPPRPRRAGAPQPQQQRQQPHSEKPQQQPQPQQQPPPQQQQQQQQRQPHKRVALDLAQSMPLVERALGVLERREVRPQLGLLKSTMLQLDSTFN